MTAGFPEQPWTGCITGESDSILVAVAGYLAMATSPPFTEYFLDKCRSLMV